MSENVTGFFMLSPKQLTLLSTLLGLLLIDNLDIKQQNSLGNFIVNVGQAILVAAAQGEVLQSNNSGNDDYYHRQIKILKEQIWELEKKLNCTF
ncbi:MAG: hypothetical protein GX092_07020 [Clostridia bacterium]|jgi:hypothetical protein|nr:hypothetical protein [Clostridia bacterium]